MPSLQLRSVVGLLAVGLLLTGCGVDAAGPATPPPSASTTAAGVSIPVELPCHAIDRSEVPELIGSDVAFTAEFRPGDTPFGPGRPPVSNFGCLYAGEGGQPEFTLGIAGPADEVAFRGLFPERPGCVRVDAPPDLPGALVSAESCLDAEDTSLTSVTLTGLFGEAAVSCGSSVPTTMVDAAYTEVVTRFCAEVLLDLAD